MLALVLNEDYFKQMGRIFTPEQLTLNQYPIAGAHQAAGRYILEALFDSNGGNLIYPHITGALVYGSTAEGRADIRSDLDILVTYSPTGDPLETLTALRSLLSRTERDFNVQVDEPNIYYRTALSSPAEHSFDILFARHLLEAQSKRPEWVRGIPPANDLGHHAMVGAEKSELFWAMHNTVLRYCSGKTRQFTRLIANDRGEIDYKSFQRALELPKAVGRKIISLSEDHTIFSTPTLFELEQTSTEAGLELTNTPAISEPEIAAQILEGSISRATGPNDRNILELGLVGFRNLIDLVGEYDILLDQTVNGSSPITQYEAWLNQNYGFACMDAYRASLGWTTFMKQTLGYLTFKSISRKDRRELGLGDSPDEIFY